MHPTLVLASSFLALVAAQNTEVPLFLLGFDPQPLVASIIGSVSLTQENPHHLSSNPLLRTLPLPPMPSHALKGLHRTTVEYQEI